jgi:hypothetical protein
MVWVLKETNILLKFITQSRIIGSCSRIGSCQWSRRMNLKIKKFIIRVLVSQFKFWTYKNNIMFWRKFNYFTKFTVNLSFLAENVTVPWPIVPLRYVSFHLDPDRFTSSQIVPDRFNRPSSWPWQWPCPCF